MLEIVHNKIILNVSIYHFHRNIQNLPLLRGKKYHLKKKKTLKKLNTELTYDLALLGTYSIIKNRDSNIFFILFAFFFYHLLFYSQQYYK